MPERYLGESFGKYRVDALVGSGGFAWVYRGWDPELEVPVAVKILKPHYAGDEQIEQRFRREASTAARLRHPNIVAIYAVGRDHGAAWFAMDFLPGGLASRLEVAPTLPEELLARVGIDVASALGFAHRAGVIHRDIKVDNILFDEHGNAVVADFGIARALAAHAGQTGTNMVVGTPHYFSPEQARGLALDGRADIYSLGVTLFRAATGVLPFNGDDWYEIARQHVEDRPPRPRALNPGLSRDLEHVILRCLEKHQDDRYATGEELGQALAALVHDRSASSSARTLIMPAGNARRFRVAGGLAAARRGVRRLGRSRWTAPAVIVLALSSALLYLGNRGEAAGRVGSAAGTLPDTVILARNEALLGAPRPRTDSATSDDKAGLTKPGSVPRRVLDLSAPSGAALSVNGVAVGTGRWHSDTLKPGRYVVAAAVRSLPGCPTTIDRRTVTLGDSGTRVIRLAPRACGSLSLDVRPSGAHYLVRSLTDQQVVRGTAPLAAPLVLPVGEYRVEIEARYCSQFGHTLRIEPGAAGSPLRAWLICPDDEP